MCDYLYFDEKHTMCSNQAQLNAIVPFEKWVWEKHHNPEYDPKTCLCPVNLKATLLKAGYKSKTHGNGNIIATRAPPKVTEKE